MKTNTSSALSQMKDKPECQLIGKDGNVFNIIGLVAKALKKGGYPEASKEFTDKALHSESYEAVLALAAEYTEVS